MFTSLLPDCLFVYQFVYLLTYLFVYLFTSLFTRLFTLGLLNRAIGDIDRATLEGMQQNLPPRQEHSLAGFRDQLLNTIEEISQLISPVSVAAKGETENLGHSVTNMVSRC